MLKYELIPEQLIHQGIITPDQIHAPQPMSKQLILKTHDLKYFEAVRSQTLSPREMRKIGFPPSPELVAREIEICQGTLDCANYALQYGAALNVAGGTHHAYADKGEGFCIFNDFAVAANCLLHEKRIKKALILDLDVHQGNGTASLMANEPRVFTFSMHGKDNYPLHKEHSDWDIELRTGTTGDEYLDILSKALPKLYDKAKPDIVFFLSGVDVLAGDKLGKLRLNMNDCLERDKLAIGSAYQRGLPLVVAMGGGYSPNIADIVDAHCQTFKTVEEVYYA